MKRLGFSSIRLILLISFSREIVGIQYVFMWCCDCACLVAYIMKWDIFFFTIIDRETMLIYLKLYALYEYIIESLSYFCAKAFGLGS